MSGGADELDEAIALANGTPHSGRPGAPGRTGGTPPPGGPAPSPDRDLPWPDARARARRAAGALPSRDLPLDEALRHTLATPLDALTDLPSFDTSAMDGWAVSGPGPWTLTGPAGAHGLLAGSVPAPLPDGHAVPVATGARVPPGASAVLRSEYGVREGDRLRTGGGARRPVPGTDIRPRGQECRSGDRLLPAGTRVTPAVLGLAAAAGYDRLAVVRRPRAEVLVLGDELLHRGLPHDGRIRDALGPALAPWLAELGADVLVTRRLGDDAEALYEAVTTTTADLLVTTGGTARGPVDHLRPVLARAGARLLVEGVRVRPGHPMLLARLPRTDDDGAGRTGSAADTGNAGNAGGSRGSADTGDTGDTGNPGSRDGGGSTRAARSGAGGPFVAGGPFLVGLPGNPLAALSGLVTLAAPLVRTLGDLPPEHPVYAHLTDDVQGHPRDTRLVPVAYAPAHAQARPLRYNGPAMLRGIAVATALAVVPPGGASEGAEVRVLPLPWFQW